MVTDALQRIWNQILDILAVFVTPNWGDAIGWFPLLLVFGVIGPILTIIALFWLWYAVRKPRVQARYEDARRPAEIVSGQPVYPAGEPYCGRDRLIYEPGVARCDICGDELRVACPKCGLVREAPITRCGNCGLAFDLKPRTRALQVSGPPPGGAAAA